MFRRLRQKRPGSSSLAQLLFYELCRRLACLFLRLFYGYRVDGLENIPATGGVLIIANHQSFFDPPLVGCRLSSRHLDFLARAGLFRSRPMGWIFGALNSTPIDESGRDAAAVRQIIRLIREGHAVVLFPEGSRTPDGRMQAFKRGFVLILRRTRCPVVPAAVDGAYDAWPRHRRWPKLFGCRMQARIGEALTIDDLEGEEDAMVALERRIDRMRLEVRQSLRSRTGGRYPPPGLGDVLRCDAEEGAA